MYLLNQLRPTKQNTQTRSQQKPQTSAKCFWARVSCQPRVVSRHVQTNKNPKIPSGVKHGTVTTNTTTTEERTRKQTTKTSSSAVSENRTRNTRFSGRKYSELHPQSPCLFAERTPETLYHSECFFSSFEGSSMSSFVWNVVRLRPECTICLLS